jgi:hypothetical protein
MKLCLEITLLFFWFGEVNNELSSCDWLNYDSSKSTLFEDYIWATILAESFNFGRPFVLKLALLTYVNLIMNLRAG